MMHRVPRTAFLAILLGSVSFSCGPQAESAVPAAPRSALPGGGKAVEPGAPSVPWSEKTFAQRVEFMGLVFFPRMQSLFEGEGDAAQKTAAPARRGEPFRCQSCHGENMIDVAYAMPNTLHPLPEAAPFETALLHDEKTARFMKEQVVPAVQELLGATESSTSACHLCHARAQTPAGSPPP